jgi:hypothetical protein
MKMQDHIDRITEVTDKLKNEVDPQEKERLTREFWLLALDAFNEHIAGTITTADGRKLHTPPFEI